MNGFKISVFFLVAIYCIGSTYQLNKITNLNIALARNVMEYNQVVLFLIDRDTDNKSELIEILNQHDIIKYGLTRREFEMYEMESKHKRFVNGRK